MKELFSKFSNNNHARKLCAWIMMIVTNVSLIACSDDIVVIRSFPKEETLKEETVDSLNRIYKTFSVAHVQNKYVFSVKLDYHLEIYSDDGIPCWRMLRKGHGDNEWIAPMLTGQEVSINNKSYVSVLERAGARLYAIDINDTVSQRILLEDFGKRGIPEIRTAYLLADGSYMGIKDTEWCECFLLKKDAKAPTVVDLTLDKQLFNVNPNTLSQGLSTYNGNKKMMALSLYAYPLFLIMDEDAQHIMKIQIGNAMPTYNEQTAEDAHDYILDICSTDNYVYLLYDDPEKANETSIIVFDWNGNPVARYHTDRLMAFAVDEEKSLFIGIKEDDTNGACCILRWHILTK